MSGCPESHAGRAELAVHEPAPVAILAAGIGTPDADAITLACRGGIEFFPDGVVLESLWRTRRAWADRADALRRDLGTSVDGEEFYLQARRAVWLAACLEHRGPSRLHAFRSDMVLCAWIASKLCACELKLSATIETSPVLSGTALRRILPEVHLLSVADERLAEALGARDQLGLGEVNTPNYRRIGPIKLRRKPSLSSFREAARRWMDQIVESS